MDKPDMWLAAGNMTQVKETAVHGLTIWRARKERKMWRGIKARAVGQGQIVKRYSPDLILVVYMRWGEISPSVHLRSGPWSLKLPIPEKHLARSSQKGLQSCIRALWSYSVWSPACNPTWRGSMGVKWRARVGSWEGTDRGRQWQTMLDNSVHHNFGHWCEFLRSLLFLWLVCTTLIRTASLAVDGNQHRDLQQDSIQSLIDFRALSPAPSPQGSEWKGYKSQRWRTTSRKQHHSDPTARMHRSHRDCGHMHKACRVQAR